MVISKEKNYVNVEKTFVEKRYEEWVIEQLSIPYDTTNAIKQSERQNRSDWARALKCGRV
ncbi:hypothetical protein [Lysinibacillus sp. fls2-241-R2A-57]|uniref:hypothetical protein n=1 Tax=Lysinibacillus sp. fls2-241-R2A-57 TaxID=3040292 RepID=UPI0025573925|nr:hypothetical protein [Lysinibacillus sp. fls2-241-R2A-57]